MTTLTLDKHRKRVTLEWPGGRWSCGLAKLRHMKRLNTIPKLRAAYQGMGYRLIEVRHEKNGKVEIWRK